VERFEVTPVGYVRSPLTSLDAAPRQGDEGAPDAEIVFEPDAAAALAGIRPGDRVVLLTWFHLAARDVLSVHPRGDLSRERQGVFATRSPARPNPIGLHEVEVSGVHHDALSVRGLEAIDGTPVLDVKPVLSPDISAR
jgi:tRNA-Thr(GGU) m(6)t(6)A37 methyltransferase TsaA